MVENITVTDKNGNGIFAEGISYIQFLSSGKKYLLYTLNEPVANDRSKMYVAELTDNVGSLEKIPDEEWVKVRSELERLEHGEVNPDIKFMSMANTTFNIGIPKKLAITAEMKQSFKDKQAAGLLASQQQQMVDAPAVEASSGGFFNKEEVDQTPAFVSPDSTAQNQVNIFNNPMKPEVVPDLTAGGVVEQGSVQGIGQQGGTQMVEGMMPQGQNMMNGQMMNNPQMVAPSVAPTPGMVASTPAPMPQAPAIETSGMATAQESAPGTGNYNPQAVVQNVAAMPATGNIVDNPFIVNPLPANNGDNTATDVATALETASLTDTGNSIQYQQGLATNLSNDLGIATGITPKSEDKEVTKEEALEALEVLNRYFKNTKELPSALASELNGQAKEEVKESLSSEPAPLPEPQPEVIVPEENIGTTDNGMAQEQGKTLSLVPEGMANVASTSLDNTGYTAAAQVPQENLFQVPAMGSPVMETQNIIPGPGFDGQIQENAPMQTGYVASSNGPAVDMSTTVNNINDVPVTLPDNYNPQAAVNNNVLMGPGSLPAENYAKVA